MHIEEWINQKRLSDWIFSQKIKLYGDYKRYALDSKTQDTNKFKIKGSKVLYHTNSSHLRESEWLH